MQRGGQPVAFDTRKATALLAHLALTGRPRSRDALCDLLWPGQDAEHARGALRRTLSVLRKGIGDEWLDTTTDRVALRDDPELVVDVRRFRALAADDATAIEAVGLFRGTLLEGFAVRDSPEFDEWYAYEADALERELGGALARACAILVARGEPARAIAYAERRLALDPLQESAHRELIRLHALCGDRAAALEQYRACVRTLSQELGVGPSEATVALSEQVSGGTLEPAPLPVVRTSAAPPAELPLVGRGAALSALLAALDDGAVAVIEGEAGIGKTRLAHELVDAAGRTALAARCFDDEAELAYGPVVELLAAAARRPLEGVPAQRLADAALLVPELAEGRSDLPPPVALDAPGAQARLFESVAAVLSAAAGMVFVDDVHAADAATLDVLAYVARRSRGRELLMVLAWRSEAVPPGHRLRRLVAGLGGAVRTVRLDRLGEADVAELVRSVQGADAPAQDVYADSEGLPLFVSEYLATSPETRRADLRDVLAARVAGFGAETQQVLETAAVIGRSFDARTVRGASGRSEEETADALAELVGRGIVRELGDGYDFAHARLRGHVYDAMGTARRLLLHRRVAEAVLSAARGHEAAALAAAHLAAAGDEAAAAAQHLYAAEHAAALLAHRDALAHLEAALALGHPDAAAVHERMGDLHTLLGEYAAAISSYEHARSAAAGTAEQAAIDHKLGGVHHRRGEWTLAAGRFAHALDVAPADATRARLLADLSLTLLHDGQRERAAELAAEARAVAEAAGDARARAQAHNLLGVLARDAGELGSAREHLERSLGLADELGDRIAHVAALNNLALLARDAGELRTAVELTETALELCALDGDRHREAALENNLADLRHALHEDEASMAHLKRAAAIFADIGAEDGARAPAVWQLVSW